MKIDKALKVIQKYIKVSCNTSPDITISNDFMYLNNLSIRLNSPLSKGDYNIDVNILNLIALCDLDANIAINTEKKIIYNNFKSLTYIDNEEKPPLHPINNKADNSIFNPNNLICRIPKDVFKQMMLYTDDLVNNFIYVYKDKVYATDTHNLMYHKLDKDTHLSLSVYIEYMRKIFDNSPVSLYKYKDTYAALGDDIYLHRLDVVDYQNEPPTNRNIEPIISFDIHNQCLIKRDVLKSVLAFAKTSYAGSITFETIEEDTKFMTAYLDDKSEERITIPLVLLLNITNKEPLKFCISYKTINTIINQFKENTIIIKLGDSLGSVDNTVFSLSRISY